MQIKADSHEEYINQVPGDRRETINRLRKIILENLPQGFTEIIGYGMIGYVVPKSIQTKHRPDMGKGCIRFKKPERIPNKVIGELVSKVSVDTWITKFEKNIKNAH